MNARQRRKAAREFGRMVAGADIAAVGSQIQAAASVFEQIVADILSPGEGRPQPAAENRAIPVWEAT